MTLHACLVRCLVLGVFLAGLAFSLPGHSAEPFDYFANSWNVIGLKDYRDGTRLTPDNRLLLAEGTQVQLRLGGNLYCWP